MDRDLVCWEAGGAGVAGAGAGAGGRRRWALPGLGGHVHALDEAPWAAGGGGGGGGGGSGGCLLALGTGEPSVRLWRIGGLQVQLEGVGEADPDPYPVQTLWKGVRAKVRVGRTRALERERASAGVVRSSLQKCAARVREC